MTPGVVPTGEWVHVAVTVDRSSPTGVVFYLNGMPVIQGDATLVPGKIMSGNSVRIGASHRKDGFPSPPSMTGLLDEVQIYHRALFDDEVAALRLRRLRWCLQGAHACFEGHTVLRWAVLFRCDRHHRQCNRYRSPVRSHGRRHSRRPEQRLLRRERTGINSGGNVQSDQRAGRPVDRSAAGHRSTGWADRGRRLGLLDGHDRGSRHGHGHAAQGSSRLSAPSASRAAPTACCRCLWANPLP